MTDPKDSKTYWPKGLAKILEDNGCKSLVELVRKKIKPKEKQQRWPYKDQEEPD